MNRCPKCGNRGIWAPLYHIGEGIYCTKCNKWSPYVAGKDVQTNLYPLTYALKRSKEAE